MPIYVYECPEGHETERVLSIKNHTTAVKCSHKDCFKPAKQVIRAYGGFVLNGRGFPGKDLRNK